MKVHGHLTRKHMCCHRVDRSKNVSEIPLVADDVEFYILANFLTVLSIALIF